MNLTRNDIKNIEPIQNLKNLEVLILKGNIYLEDISPLSNLVNLKILNLSETKVSNINPIKYLIKLEEFNLKKDYIDSKNKKLTDASLLSNLINLKKLNFILVIYQILNQ